MTIDTAVDVTVVSLNTWIVVLYSIGTYFLVCLYKEGLKSPQQVYLVNLALSELTINLMELVRRVVAKAVRLKGGGEPNQVATMNRYLLIVMFTGVSPVFYLIIVYITIDRLLAASLSLKYSAYWDEVKAKTLVICTWMICLLTSGMFAMVYYLRWNNLNGLKYVVPVLELAFLLLAVGTYSMLFTKYRKSYRMSRLVRHCRAKVRLSKRVRKATSRMTVFWKSRFLTSVLIIINFFAFVMVPGFVYTFYGVLSDNESDMLYSCCWVAFAISNIGDAFVYVFLTHSVKNMMIEKVDRVFRPKRRLVRHMAWYSTTGSRRCRERLTRFSGSHSGLECTDNTLVSSIRSNINKSNNNNDNNNNDNDNNSNEEVRKTSIYETGLLCPGDRICCTDLKAL